MHTVYTLYKPTVLIKIFCLDYYLKEKKKKFQDLDNTSVFY